jgi:hypothetical protein
MNANFTQEQTIHHKLFLDCKTLKKLATTNNQKMRRSTTRKLLQNAAALLSKQPSPKNTLLHPLPALGSKKIPFFLSLRLSHTFRNVLKHNLQAHPSFKKVKVFCCFSGKE